VKRLVIDDVRIMRFAATYARTAAAAICAIRDGGPWDEVWWDHDLGGEDTVHPVMLWVLEAAFYGAVPQLGTCVVHTDNPVGRDMLTQQLSKHYPVVQADASVHLKATLPH